MSAEGCPVKHEPATEGCPVKHEPASSSASGGCPVKGDTEEGYNPAANDLSYNQHRQPGQKKDMSTTRPVSGIPKSTFTPGHQFKDVNRWVYPSGKRSPHISFLQRTYETAFVSKSGMGNLTAQ